MVIMTSREYNVLFCLAHGYKNNEIGSKLCISEHTVKAHLESIYFKLNAKNRIQAIILAVQNNIIDLNNIHIPIKVEK